MWQKGDNSGPDTGLHETRFSDLSEMLEAAEKINGLRRSPDWDLLKQQVLQGDESLVTQEFRDFMRQLDDKVPTRRMEQVMAPAGAYPIVPAVMAGDPRNMLRRQIGQNQSTPVKIYFNTSTSGGVPRCSMRLRGLAAAALTAKLAQIRPVQLYIAQANPRSQDRSDPHNLSVTYVPVPTAPLNIGRIIACVDGRLFLSAMMDLRRHYGNSQGNVCFGPPNAFKAGLGLQPHDIYFGAAHVSDPIAQNPIGFVRKMLDQYAEQQ